MPKANSCMELKTQGTTQNKIRFGTETWEKNTNESVVITMLMDTNTRV
jgi:hypothetical protein